MDTQKAKILVVDDEANVLFTMTSILQQEGYDVDGVSDGTSAIKAIREKHYDLVLTDLNMPGVDGLAVLAEVRKRSPNTVTVMITGYASLDSALEAIQLGAYEYLLKPTEVPELKLAVKRSLERKRLSEIDTLYRISREITSALNLQTIATQVADAVRSVLALENACVIALDHHEGDHCPAGLRLALEDSETQEKLCSNAIITSETPTAALQRWAAEQSLCSYALVPGIIDSKLHCVIFADNNGKPFEFHASALRFLQSLAGQTALAVENASLIAALKRNNEEITAANEKLRELDALKSKFLSVATHELRTPLSIILGYNSMLAESLGDRLSAEEKRTLEESMSACKRLIRLVNSMLDINQIQAGKMHMNMAREDLRQIASGIVSLFQHEAQRREIKLTLDVPSRLPKLEMDSERMQQVLINLVGNALKFTPAGGTVTVSLRERREREAVEMAVRDTGIGISKQDQERIFDEFEQIRQRAEQRHREGSGLGLAIARRIAEAHEGQIRVTSAPGKGSTFTVTLPIRARKNEIITAVSA
jgi:signal transduction histidine kinase/DNA-binding response OmpR family regulator